MKDNINYLLRIYDTIKNNSGISSKELAILFRTDDAGIRKSISELRDLFMKIELRCLYALLIKDIS
ncbi:hypothetical protein LJB88_03165 [Erysipelotrichaceae bacterium OttesenSCG-928-M19]|nr:hypothetical protein [Erysipelotrichaceae bacterium OttesenSCG-928-M19]